ncbi:pre-mRNA-processing factor 39 isoform X2 [Parambassis ranga]|uniref:Pre-mRNA-processing factor 39 isoform X2 n=1 Tax=Parambassis ranga TaxID=210632 RepID=A0A6P7J5L1_9TELE|nr:pre-mRNA-processing factor 39-like isoform X2 [Parambassis ranga]
MAAEGCEEMCGNGDLDESSVEATKVPSPPPAEASEASEENGSTSMATEHPVGPDPASFSIAPGTEDEEGELPADFERLWKAAHDNPQDFTSWTDLLQYCEQESHFSASRRSLEAFLARYPLCYGYWKKFADLERRAGYNNKAEEVCIRGLQAIPLSVDLWIHYINLLLGTLDMNLPESPERIRSVFEDAVAAAGLDFHSDRLWDLYVEWEKEQGNMKNAAAVLDRVLKVPTQLYNTHYTKLKEHLNSYPPKDVLSLEEYEELRELCCQSQKAERAEQAQEQQEDRPPGEEEPDTPKDTDSEELIQKIREHLLVLREKVYQDNEAEVRQRWSFEDAIKRPYFHVKPLDRLQLRAWHSYLDWEIAQLSRDTKEQSTEDPSQTTTEESEVTPQHQETSEEASAASDDHRVRILFERCLIACALYEEFWTRYILYLEPQSVDEARAVYRRACEIHLAYKPNIHMQWAAFEERHGNLTDARQVLEALEKTLPGLAVVRLRRAALERRAGQLEQSEALLTEAVAESKEKPVLHAFYSIKLARLLLKLGRDPSRARRVLQEALEISPDNDKLHMNLLELEVSGDPWASAEAVRECVTRALAAPLAPHTKILLSQRGLQFAEDYSSSIQSVLSVYEEHQKLLKELGGTKRGAENGDEDPEKLSKTDDGSAVVSAQAPPTMPHVPITTPPPPMMGTDMSAQAGYGGYSSWYQQPQYGSYGYQNTWNYNQGYYPPS